MPRKKRITKKVLFAKAVEILKPWMNLQNWKIIVKFGSSTKGFAAYCSAHPEYKLATIRVNTKELPRLTHNEIVAVAIHEMTHCILWELGNWAADLTKDKHKIEIARRYEEQSVTNIEKILVPLLEPILNEALTAEGYELLDLTFTDFVIEHQK